jgi:hypothetical protein
MKMGCPIHHVQNNPILKLDCKGTNNILIAKYGW